MSRATSLISVSRCGLYTDYVLHTRLEGFLTVHPHHTTLPHRHTGRAGTSASRSRRISASRSVSSMLSPRAAGVRTWLLFLGRSAEVRESVKHWSNCRGLQREVSCGSTQHAHCVKKARPWRLQPPSDRRSLRSLCA